MPALAPTRIALKDEEKRVADQVVNLALEKRNVRELLSKANLIKHGFLNPTVDEAPERMIRKKPPADKASKASLAEKARGKRPVKESTSESAATPGFA